MSAGKNPSNTNNINKFTLVLSTLGVVYILLCTFIPYWQPKNYKNFKPIEIPTSHLIIFAISLGFSSGFIQNLQRLVLEIRQGNISLKLEEEIQKNQDKINYLLLMNTNKFIYWTLIKFEKKEKQDREFIYKIGGSKLLLDLTKAGLIKPRKEKNIFEPEISQYKKNYTIDILEWFELTDLGKAYLFLANQTLTEGNLNMPEIEPWELDDYRYDKIESVFKS